MNNKPMHVHFMGICGSGAATIAMLALEAGFKVSGCDASLDSYYADELKKREVTLYAGHDASHITDDVDIVAVSPAIFDVSFNHPELILAKERGILMTWQEFMGKYLQKGKRTICLSGTHGKTTSTFLLAHLLLNAGLDPSVEGGSVYEPFKSGGRTGKSDWFICEADEFNRNFYHYYPEIAVINNIEMDHPECFRDYQDVCDTFYTFLAQNKNLKHIVANGNDPGVQKVLTMFSETPNASSVTAHLYFSVGTDITFPETLSVHKVFYQIDKKDPSETVFSVYDGDLQNSYMLKELKGDHNVRNCVGCLLAALIAGATRDSLKDSTKTFRGTKRRFDKVGEHNGIPVYDDYAHHPTEIAALLNMCRDYFPEKKILAIFEPHQISRLTLMFEDYVKSLTIADHVIISKTHIGREKFKDVKPIEKDIWTNASPRILYEEDSEKIKEITDRLIVDKECDIILVVGAAGSYKISRNLCE